MTWYEKVISQAQPELLKEKSESLAAWVVHCRNEQEDAGTAAAMDDVINKAEHNYHRDVYCMNKKQQLFVVAEMIEIMNGGKLAGGKENLAIS